MTTYRSTGANDTTTVVVLLWFRSRFGLTINNGHNGSGCGQSGQLRFIPGSSQGRRVNSASVRVNPVKPSRLGQTRVNSG
ncbi:hypothetical protein Hanom_Chr05g00417141 [Helianthus anomalus]